MKTLKRIWHSFWADYHADKQTTDWDLYFYHEERFEHHMNALDDLN